MDAGEHLGEIGETGTYGKGPVAGEIGLRERTAGLGGGGRGKCSYFTTM